MNKSNYITSIPEAEWEEVEAMPLADFQDDQTRKLYDAIVNMGDKVFPGRRGQLFTIALTTGGLAKNPVDLNKWYYQNSEAIDGYFNRVDMDALGNAIGGPVNQSIKDQIPTLLTGAALGLGVSVLLRVFRIL